ncbi:hypothetical protein FIBSPDRAFT_805970 [Athelia psychrophila]|uniref:VPS37 C-terminal domain-containing protein n=1 Tax=Athelia psychrophila TaxID=1759441 RepID=A0A167VPJ1_9AGAM|nr:hypothetical protein FIBSPDRAFT_805970 [Fibularhizoctonia sp. CBS 109695]
MSDQLFIDFPELANLSRQDLEDLLNDPAYFQATFHSLRQVQAFYQGHSDLGLANESIAKNNLALQDKLYSLRNETQEAFNEAKALEARWADLEKEQRDVYQRFTPQFLLMRLRHATTAQDDQSEALASAFVQASSTAPAPGNGDIDAFVKEFKNMRNIYHKRVMWGERWTAGEVAWRDE